MFNELDIFKDFLHQQQLNWTPQRKKILEVLLSCEKHISIELLHEKIQERYPSIGISTLYRTLKLLVDCGLVESHSFKSGKKTYELILNVGHHDHLICTQCETTIEFEHPLIERYQMEICERYNFILMSHKMDLFGVCKDCRNK
ncbi:MAG: transcriptional repressor [Nitrospinae bacterium]|nr:transcriptional repressor [Nitrospinota bacterium]